jgi:hypothetical protein
MRVDKITIKVVTNAILRKDRKYLLNPDGTEMEFVNINEAEAYLLHLAEILKDPRIEETEEHWDPPDYDDDVNHDRIF